MVVSGVRGDNSTAWKEASSLLWDKTMKDELCLREAYEEARFSEDPRTHNGAILVVSDVIIARGSNRLPPKIENRPARLVSPAKYQWLIHAEQSAIGAAAFAGFSTRGATLFCPWAACSSCAKLIIAAGVKTVVVHDSLMRLTPPRWQEEVEIGQEMLTEAGVEIILYKGLLSTKILFDGQLIYV